MLLLSFYEGNISSSVSFFYFFRGGAAWNMWHQKYSNK